MANLTDRAGALSVLTATGEEVELASTWRDGAVVLVLVRHFGCQFCRQQVAELRGIVPEIEAAGASLVIVGNGTAEHLREFQEGPGAGLTIYTDPSLRVYETLGARRASVRDVLDPQLILNGARSLRQGHLPGLLRGDRRQLGGTWVVRGGGEVVYEHLSAIAGDHPPLDDLRAAVSQVAARS